MKNPPEKAETLKHWQDYADLAGIRDKDAVAKLAADEREAHGLVQVLRAHPVIALDVPGIDLLLRAPELGQRRVIRRIARGIAVRGLMQRDREDHGQRIDGDGLYQGSIHSTLL